jgi:hypothetical protein
VVEDADIVLATLGASTALAGFTLVFLGVVMRRPFRARPAACVASSLALQADYLPRSC